MIPIHNYLIVTTLGVYRSDSINELTRAFLLCGCNILNTKINVLGQNMASMFYLSGNWSAVAKLEATLPSLEQRLGLNIEARRSDEPSYPIQSMSYTIQIVAIDQPGILNGIVDFLQKQAVHIEEVSANTFITHTSTRMVTLSLKINVPNKMHLATLREQFMAYCDDHNLDGFMDPVRNV